MYSGRKIIFLLPLLLFISCSNQIEEVAEFYEDGTPQRIAVYEQIDQVKTKVEETTFYPNGNKKLSGKFSNDQREGNWTAWYESGDIWSEGMYKAGLREGSSIIYHPNNSMHIKGQYKNDEPFGIWQWYDENGVLINEIDYGSKNN